MNANKPDKNLGMVLLPIADTAVRPLLSLQKTFERSTAPPFHVIPATDHCL